MAKATRAQEVSTGTSDSYTVDELSDPEAPQHIVITRPILGEVDRAVITESVTAKEVKSSTTQDGGDSMQSSRKEQTENGKPNQSPQQPAPPMENPSKATAKETSGADSADGSTPETQPQQSGRRTPAKKAAPRKQTSSGARSSMMMGAEDDFDEFD